MKETSRELCIRMKKDLSLFHFLSENDLEKIAGYFKCRQVPAGETLWREGDACGNVAFIVSGRVEVKKQTEFKGKEVVIGVYSKGTMVGELCVLDGSPRAVTAVAMDDVGLLILSSEDFENIINKYPGLGVKLLKDMLFAVSTRLKKSFDRLAAIF